MFPTFSYCAIVEYYDLICNLQGTDARYTVAMYLFHQHAELSISTRRLKALTKFLDWRYDGNPSKWKMEFLNHTREIIESGTTLNHLMLLFAFRSFEGKNTQVQSMIAVDIDHPDTVHEDMSFDPIATKYASFLSTLQAGKSGAINAVDQTPTQRGRGRRGRGGKDGGGKGDKGGRGGKGGRGKGERTDKTPHDPCPYCKKHHPEQASNHRERDCPNIAKDKAKKAQDADTKTQNTVSDAAIADLCNRIKTGGIKLMQTVQVHEDSFNTLRLSTTSPIPENGVEECQAHEGESGQHVVHGNQLGCICPQLVAMEHGPGTTTCAPCVAQLCSSELTYSDSIETTPGSFALSDLVESAHPINVATTDDTKPHICLSLCDGMGGLAISLKAIGAPSFDRYIAVEKEPASRMVCNSANPKDGTFPGVEHGLNGKHDIFDITEDDIESMPPDSLGLLASAPMCNDHSRLRLLSDRPGYTGPKRTKKYPRKGFNGKYGKTFRQTIKIVGWSTKHHPNSKYFIENVDFSDMKEDWEEACEALGKPYKVRHKHYSATNRVRCYWTNMDLPDDFLNAKNSIDPNDFMLPGRTVMTYDVKGTPHVRPIGGSWSGDPDAPFADTGKPLLVNDINHKTPQHLHPSEAEGLHGLPIGCTAGEGITNQQRLKCIGAGWDIPIISLFMKHYGTNRLASMVNMMTSHLDKDEGNPNLEAAEAIYLMHEKSADEFNTLISEVMGSQGMEEAAKIIALSQYYRKMLKVIEDDSSVIIDSGAARHCSPNTTVTDPDSIIKLQGFTGKPL